MSAHPTTPTRSSPLSQASLLLTPPLTLDNSSILLSNLLTTSNEVTPLARRNGFGSEGTRKTTQPRRESAENLLGLLKNSSECSQIRECRRGRDTEGTNDDMQFHNGISPSSEVDRYCRQAKGGISCARSNKPTDPSTTSSPHRFSIPGPQG